MVNCLISAAGLCDINECSATSEDRCKSPTSGNMSFSGLSKENGKNIAEALCYLNVKLPTVNHSEYTYNTTYMHARRASVREEDQCFKRTSAFNTVFIEIVKRELYGEVSFCWTVKLSDCQFHPASVFRNGLLEFNTVRLWGFETIYPFVCLFIFIFLQSFAELNRQE